MRRSAEEKLQRIDLGFFNTSDCAARWGACLDKNTHTHTHKKKTLSPSSVYHEVLN